jgi:predicted RNA binding protein YcfA (HicA-like mRNA interferase family)
MGKPALEQCRKGKEFIGYAERHGGYVDRQSGSHAIVKGPTGGTCPVPVHPGEIPTGTRRSIMKRFQMIGILILMGICLYGLAVLPILQ